LPPQNLRGESFDGLAGVLGGGQPTAVPASHQTKNVFYGTAKFGSVIEQRGIAFV
jgi:hypothetical protein